MGKTVKLILTTILLLCLFDMPYGFYQLVRFLAFVGFGFLAYKANEGNQKTDIIIYLALALLFQPFLKVSLGRTIWMVVDVIVGAGLVISLLPLKDN